MNTVCSEAQLQLPYLLDQIWWIKSADKVPQMLHREMFVKPMQLAADNADDWRYGGQSELSTHDAVQLCIDDSSSNASTHQQTSSLSASKQHLERSTVLWPFDPGQPGWARGETYWNNQWVFISRVSFLSLNLLYQSTTGKPSGLVIFLLYRHALSTPCQCNE